MQVITVSGNLGKDAEYKQTQSGDEVLSFSVGSKVGFGDKATTEWFRCSIWGKRANSLRDYLVKGIKVTVHGDFSTNEYEGKTYLQIRATNVEFMSAKEKGSTDTGHQNQNHDYRNDDLDDDVPF